MKFFYLICVSIFILSSCQTGAKRVCLNGYKESKGIKRTFFAGTDSEVPPYVHNVCACVAKKWDNGYDIETATIECNEKYGQNQ